MTESIIPTTIALNSRSHHHRWRFGAVAFAAGVAVADRSGGALYCGRVVSLAWTGPVVAAVVVAIAASVLAVVLAVVAVPAAGAVTMPISIRKLRLVSGGRNSVAASAGGARWLLDVVRAACG